MKNLFKPKKEYLFLLAIIIGGLLLACCLPSLVEGMSGARPTTATSDEQKKLAMLQAQVQKMLAGGGGQ